MTRWILIAFFGGLTLIALPVVLIAGAANPPDCVSATPGGPSTGAAGIAAGGDWLATAYGPPWGGIQGQGVTATGLDLTAGPAAYEVAVDPTQIPLRSFVHVTPNPFGTDRAFYAGDTGGAILGKHVDIYDWHGREDQNAWGARQVNVRPAATPGAGNLLDQISPGADPTPSGPGTGSSGCASTTGGPLPIVNGPAAKILPNGQAAAPADAPDAVKRAIAAGNQIIAKPYIYGGGHGQPLTELAPSYDCSSSTSYLLHGGGLLGDFAEISGDLMTYGQPGPGRWITLYANTKHVFIYIAGIVMDTAWYATASITPTTPSSGPRWQPAWIVGPQSAAGVFVARHPEGY